MCLGCMSYGQAATPGILQWHWTLNEEDSRVHIRRALEAGINFFDTANVYSNGESEAVLGRAHPRLRAPRRRGGGHQGVGAGAVKGPNGSGLSRKAILSEIDKSLQRLGIDYVDLYIDSPLRLRHAAGRDARGAERRGARRQGAVSRRVVDARLAVHEGAGPAARPRVGAVHLDAELLQPAVPRGRARDAAAVRVGGHRRDAVVAAGARPAGAAVEPTSRRPSARRPMRLPRRSSARPRTSTRP